MGRKLERARFGSKANLLFVIFSLCTTLLFVNIVGASWNPVTSPTTTKLYSVFMVSASDGWIVGDSGTILHWDGANWSTVTSPAANVLESVFMVSASDGWIVGEDGTILHWDGASWSTVTSPATILLFSVSMVSANDGWAVGQYGTILHWDGASWSTVTSPAANILESVFMVSASDGWIVGEDGTILHWDGASWSTVTSPTANWLRWVFMVSANDGWIVGEDGTILYWSLEPPLTQYALTISVAGSGTTNPAPGSHMYDEGAVVNVDAQPGGGWRLDHWLLDGSNVGGDDPLPVTMNTNHTLRAVFGQVPDDGPEPPLKAPVASFTFSPESPVVDEPVSFDAGSSHDPDGTITSYVWDFGDEATDSGETTTHAYKAAGTYTVTLTVKDNDGQTGAHKEDITVIGIDVTNPVADCGEDEAVEAGTTVIFNAGGSRDDVGIDKYEWNFGDGTIGIGMIVSHVYREPGIYVVTLIVEDAAGNRGTDSVIVTVEGDMAEVGREPRSVYIVAEVAVAGAAVTAATAALAGFSGLGQTFNSAVSRLAIPEWLKDFLQLYGEKIFETIDNVKLEALGKVSFITKGELVFLGISALIMTVVFGFVEANGLPRFLNPSVLATVIPSTLFSVCVVSIAEQVSEALCARTCKVYGQFRFWMYGLGLLLISGLLFLFPSGSPGITRYQSGQISNKTKGLIVLSKMFILLTLTIPFAGFFMLGFKIIGDAGLLLTLMTVSYSLVPLKPLSGKAVFDYRKEVSLIALVSTGILFYSCTVNLLPHVTYLAVGVVSAFLAAITIIQLRKSSS